MSVEIWLKKGLLDREKLVYEKYISEKICSSINWFTYGVNDEEIARRLAAEGKLDKNINIYQMPKVFDSRFGKTLYSLVLPFVHYKILKESNILKTNQMDGSTAAVLTKILIKKPLLIRTGFTLSIFAKHMKKNRLILFIVYLVELMAYKLSDQIIVSSNYDKEYIAQKYSIEKNKINVLYNYIDTNRFYDKNLTRSTTKILTIVRLNEQKNLFNLIEAVSKKNLTLDIYGEGELEEDLKNYSKKLRAKVNFLGIVSNDELPAIFNSYQFFILASYYEGMPKALLEAMACGCICLGTDVMGINEVIQDNYNGYLSKGTSSNDIYKMLQNLQVNNDMLINTKNVIYSSFSLESFTKKEKKILESLSEI